MCQQPMQMKSFAAQTIMCLKSSQGMHLLKVWVLFHLVIVKFPFVCVISVPIDYLLFVILL